MKRKFISIVLNMIIIIPLIAIGLNIISSNAEAESSCSAPLNNDWDISKSVQVHSVNLNSDNVKLTPLTKGFSKEFKIEDDSSTAMSMELIAGYRYNFCISLNPTLEGSSTMTNSTGDVYLMTGSNWDIYRGQYTLRDNDFVDDIEQWLPVEWKDMSTWLPFRDVHAYENIEYEEFSVGIDSSGSTWSTVFGGEDENIRYYLVLDGFDNTRTKDALSAGNDIDVEVIVEVEKRINIPIFTAYLAIGALPLSFIIIPIIMHYTYKNGAKRNLAENQQNIPLL